MDDYHEFRCAHEIQIKQWWLYQSPKYASIIKRIVDPSGAMIIPNISLTSGSGSVNGSGATKSGGTTTDGGVRASLVRKVHRSHLT